MVYMWHFLFALYHAEQNRLLSPDLRLLIMVSSGGLNLFGFYIIAFCFE